MTQIEVVLSFLTYFTANWLINGRKLVIMSVIWIKKINEGSR